MKTFFAISAVIAMLSLDQASAMRAYLKKFPNGELAFTQSLGHVSDSDTGLNDFGKLYSKNNEWSALCKETFPGAAFTVGAAFGDPCCTWKEGGKPDFTVAPFVKPTEGKDCAANKPAAASTAPAPAAPAYPTPAASQDKGKPSSPGAGNSTTPAPAGKPSAGKPSGKPSGGASPLPGSKCGVKKEAKSLDDDSVDDDAEIDY